MLKRSNKYLKLKTLRHYGEIPKPRNNEILIASLEDRLLEDGVPKLNKGNRPSWWTDLPSHSGSYRRCYGITDMMQAGFTLNMWADAEVNNADGKLNVRMSSPQFSVESFSYDQVGDCPITRQRSIPTSAFPKLVSPFQIRTPKGWSLLIMQSPLHYDVNYQIMPGIIHTDFYHEVNVVLNLMTAENFVIKAGTPMLYCLPIKRSELSIFKKIQSAGKEVASLMQGHGIGYNGIFILPKAHKGLYRQKLRNQDRK
jgi:hypothetical protein